MCLTYVSSTNVDNPIIFFHSDESSNSVFIDQTPGLTQVKECLKSLSEESDADSCKHQGYEYNDDAVDIMNDIYNDSGEDDSSLDNNGTDTEEDNASDDNSGSSCNKSDDSNYSDDDNNPHGHQDNADDDQSSDGSNSSDTTTPTRKTNNTKPTGRPTGTSIESKYAKLKIEAQAKYKIVCRYINELPEIVSRGISKKELFREIVEDEKIESALESTFVFHYETAISRIRRRNIKANGCYSPLAEIEPQLVQLVICMSKIKRSLTLTEGLHLCNELISGTEIQQKLIEFKISRNIYAESVEDLGHVGRHYWKKFLKRNSNELKAKPGRKYAIDRSSWTTIMNFSDMYEHVEEVMCESKIAHKLSVPQWVNKDGEVVEDEADSIGCKVQVQLDRPDCALVLDEVGCNLSQDCDKRVRGGDFI